MCQDNLQNLTHDLRQDIHDNCDILKEILDEYKEMRKSWEDSVN